MIPPSPVLLALLLAAVGVLLLALSFRYCRTTSTSALADYHRRCQMMERRVLAVAVLVVSATLLVLTLP